MASARLCEGKLAEAIDHRSEALNGVAIVGRYSGGYFEIRRRSTPITPYGNVGGLFTAYIILAVTRGIQAACRVVRAESEH